VALSNKAGTNLPWATVCEAISGALRARAVELTLDSAPWPCAFAAAQNVKFKIPATPFPKEEFRLRPNILVTEAELRPNEIQDLAEQILDIRKAVAPLDPKFRLRIELDTGGQPLEAETLATLNEIQNRVSKALSFE